MQQDYLNEYLVESFKNIQERPFDMYVLGPMLIYAGVKSKHMNKWLRRLIVTAGVYQLIYSWPRYKAVSLALQQSPTEVKKLFLSHTKPVAP